MPNPVTVPCPQGAWTKVATNITQGQVHKNIRLNSFTYYRTYRLTGNSAPTNLDTAVGFVDDSLPVASSAAEPIDVYIYCVDGNGGVVVEA